MQIAYGFYHEVQAQEAVWRGENKTWACVAGTSAEKVKRSIGRAYDVESCAHVDIDTTEIGSITSDRLN